MRTESVNKNHPLAQDNSTFSRLACSNATRTDDGARLLGIHTMQLEETRRGCHVGRWVSRRIVVSNQIYLQYCITINFKCYARMTLHFYTAHHIATVQ